MAPRSLANQSQRGNVEASPRHLLAGRGSSTPRFASVTLVARRNVASDATFRFGNPGRRSETWRRPPRFAATSVTRGLWTPRGWVARIELERVLFPLEKAKVWASSEPKSRGALGATRRHVSGGFSLGIQVTGTYLRAPPPRGYQTAPRFAPATGVTEAKRGVGRHVSPCGQGY